MAVEILHGISNVARKHPLSFMAALLLALAALSVAPVMLALRSTREARAVAQKALGERDLARKDAAELKDRLDQAEVARQAAEEERDQALAAEEAARRSQQDAAAVLAFLRDKLLSAGGPRVWTDPPKKGITLREAVDAAEPQVADAFPDRPLAEASVRDALGWTYFYLGEADRAIKQYECSLALCETELGPDDPLTVGYRNDLARAYRMSGRADDASRLFDQNVGRTSHAAGLARRAAKLLDQKRAVQAEVLLRECLAIRREIDADDWSTFEAESLLGEALSGQKKLAEAEPLLLSGCRGLKKHEGKIPTEHKSCLAQAVDRIVRLYEALGKKDEAARWRRELPAGGPETKS